MKIYLTPVQARRRHINHPIPRHRGRAGVVNVLRLEDQLAVDHHGKPVPIGQGQCAVVVLHTKVRKISDRISLQCHTFNSHPYQDRVKIFDPEGIDWTVQDQPDVVSLLHFQCLPPEGGEDAVCPVVGGHVKPPKHLAG